jgi:hypothetical protein
MRTFSITRIIYCLSWGLIPFVVEAQDKNEHPKKLYMDENNRLFMNASNPVYLFLSNTPDAKDAKMMHSEETKEHANPMKFDGHGKHHIKHNDIHEKVEVVFEVYADGIAPTSKAEYSKEQVYFKDGKIYIGKPLGINLPGKDEMSGLQKVLYSINSAAFADYKDAVNLTEEKEYILKHYAVDNVGNTEEVNSHHFIMDFTAPVTAYTISGDKFNDVLAPSAIISLSATDQVSGVSRIKYTFDDGTEKVYLSPLRMGMLSEGEHKITYYTIDKVSNKEEAKTYSFFVDKTAPAVTSEIIGDKFTSNGKEYYSGRTQVKLIAEDNKAGVKEVYYSMNGVDYVLYDKPFSLDQSKVMVTVKYYAIDKVENKGTSKNHGDGMLTYIDLRGPGLSYTFDGPTFATRDTTFVNKSTKIILKATDAESGVQKIMYSKNKSAEMLFEKFFNVDQEGVCNIDYTGHDNVNNTTTSNFSIIMDNTGPEIMYQHSISPIANKAIEGKELNVYSSHVGVFLSGTDRLVGVDKIYYSINGGAEKLYVGVITGFQKGKTYSFKVRAIDKLGNTSTKEFDFATEGGLLSLK